MNTSEQEQDAEVRALFETMMKEGRLADYVVDLLARSDGMDMQINGVSVSFRSYQRIMRISPLLKPSERPSGAT